MFIPWEVAMITSINQLTCSKWQEFSKLNYLLGNSLDEQQIQLYNERPDWFMRPSFRYLLFRLLPCILIPQVSEMGRTCDDTTVVIPIIPEA